MSARRVVSSVLVAGALLLTGCGGDDASTTSVADAATVAASADADVSAEVVGAIDREAEGGQRPEDLPDDVPVPAGLTTVLSMGSDGRTQAFSGNVVGTTPTEVRDELAARLEAAGWEVDRREGTAEATEVAAAALEARDGGRRYEATFVQIGELVMCQLRFTAE